MEFTVGDILGLNQVVLFYNKGLICQVVEIDKDNTNYGYVKILSSPDGKVETGERKHANLTLFKLVRKGGLYV